MTWRYHLVCIYETINLLDYILIIIFFLSVFKEIITDDCVAPARLNLIQIDVVYSKWVSLNE